MDLQDIDASLKADDFQYRLKAVSALKDYPPDIAVPRLIGQLKDTEFLVRSFVARELGSQQTQESYAALLELMKFDDTPNVRAEAANSLSLFGAFSAPHLVMAFVRDHHWLLRRSILGALVDLGCHPELFEVCFQGIYGDDLTVQGASIDALAVLANSDYHGRALAQLLELVNSPASYLRIHVARALKYFPDPDAKQALAELRGDPDHQVVAAALEDLLPQSDANSSP